MPFAPPPTPFDQAAAVQAAQQHRAQIAQALMPDAAPAAMAAPDPMQIPQPSDLLMKGMAQQGQAMRARRDLSKSAEVTTPYDPGSVGLA